MPRVSPYILVCADPALQPDGILADEPPGIGAVIPVPFIPPLDANSPRQARLPARRERPR